MSGFEMAMGEFKKRLDRGELGLIVDLRREDEFATWKIEGAKPADMLNIPQIDLVGEEEKYLERLPNDREIVLVCAHGDASKYEAELLQGRGYQARGLAGGMDAWSMLYETVQLPGEPEIHQIYRIAKGCITHVVVAGGEAVVIDAVRHLEQIRAVLDRRGARLKYVFDTHLQADHISGGRELAAAAGCPYLLCPIDANGASYPYDALTDQAEFVCGNSRIRALHSPGHTPGSTSLLLDDKILFSGDMVMETTVGRPDLGGQVDQWAELLFASIHRRFRSLGNEVMVLPSHAASVRERDREGVVRLTMGEARQNLVHFALTDKAAFVAHVKATLLENPERYQEIRRVNLGQLHPEEKRLQELEIGKNLCGMAGKQE
jgi:glyoxylase-like metal-dependent hydrolase (beta-lactamase superfamily II)